MLGFFNSSITEFCSNIIWQARLMNNRSRQQPSFLKQHGTLDEIHPTVSWTVLQSAGARIHCNRTWKPHAVKLNITVVDQKKTEEDGCVYIQQVISVLISPFSKGANSVGLSFWPGSLLVRWGVPGRWRPLSWERLCVSSDKLEEMDGERGLGFSA